ncbi:hypothetical protein DB360_13210 [Enterobacter cloacae]|nr:hypothetical protein DB360_13210 [Enterobacter cloacae]
MWGCCRSSGFARWRCAYRAYGGEMVRYLPGGAALTGPTYAVFVGRVSEAPPGVVHASSSN